MPTIPFSFALTSTNIYGVLWNPTGATVPTSVSNTALTALDALTTRTLSLDAPPGRFTLRGFRVSGVEAAARVSFGYYDTDLAAYVDLTEATELIIAGGGVVRQWETGFLIPAGATKIPCMKYIAGGGADTIRGDVEVTPLSEVAYTTGPAIPTVDLIDESDGFVLDETGARIQDS